MILVLWRVIALMFGFFSQYIRQITPRQRRLFFDKFKLVLLSSRIMLNASFCASKYFFAMYPCVQLIMLSSQIGDIRINFCACRISLSLTHLLMLAGDTWKLTIIASLHFQFHSGQPFLLNNFVIWDLLQNCFLIQVMLQTVIVVMNIIYTSIRLS